MLILPHPGVITGMSMVDRFPSLGEAKGSLISTPMGQHLRDPDPLHEAIFVPKS